MKEKMKRDSVGALESELGGRRPLCPMYKIVKKVAMTMVNQMIPKKALRRNAATIGMVPSHQIEFESVPPPYITMMLKVM